MEYYVNECTLIRDPIEKTVTKFSNLVSTYCVLPKVHFGIECKGERYYA